MNRLSIRGAGLVFATLALLAACADGGTPAASPSGPTIKIASPATGSARRGNVVTLDLTVTGLTIVKADGDTSGRTGHFHVFIDREPVAAGATIPKEPGIVHSADDPLTIAGLKIGVHRFVVVLGNGAHQRIGDARAETTVMVDGPSLDATAPATVAAGRPVPVQVAVQGVTLVKADGDTSGKTGHVHLFIDRDPTPAGMPIPKEDGIIHSADSTIPIPGLAAGEHVIWVVLGDGNHFPFDPLVADRITVTVQ
jgi:hypothetical protein